MIHSISCKNFYSFADSTSIHFDVNDHAPKNDGYFKAPSGTRLSKVLTVIGPNASGKTNLLKTLPFLKWLMVDSFNSNPLAPLPIKPFLFHNGEIQPIELSVDFEVNKAIFTYHFSLGENKILEESLKIKNKTKEKTTQKTLFSRMWSDDKKQYILKDLNFNFPKSFENLLRTNASIISTAMRLNHVESQKIGEFWEKVETNVLEAGWIGDHLLQTRTMNLIQALDFFSENDVLKEKAEKLLSRFDIGFDKFNINKEKKGDGFSINVETIHLFNGNEYSLPINYESSGTKQLFMLLKTFLQVLMHGGVAVLDELDANLHPDIVLGLFELFLSPETNPKNAQMLFSTHSHRLLNELDKYQIVLVEKNDEGASEAWRLDEMSGVRPDENYYSKYIAGTYGAIPKID